MLVNIYVNIFKYVKVCIDSFKDSITIEMSHG